MAFPPQFLEELRSRLALSDIVSKRLKLTRAGREFKAPCPFHHEKTPSFYVNDQKGFFHCFGCGAHGDIIGFVMRHDNLPFPDAVEALANEAGMAVPRPTQEDREHYERRKTIHDLVEQAARWFEQQLHGQSGRAGLEYLRGRGLDTDTMARFRLGFAPPDSGALRQHLLALKFEEEDMVTAGLLRRPDDGRAPYSFFRNRVMFPVTDRRGQVVAFGGRIMDGDGPKYVNTPDTPIFHKGTLLYGLSRARQAAADGQPVLVAEGYMDVIALVRAGFEGAVAPLGTALTEQQVQELWKLIPGEEKIPCLCFDGDGAGRRAAWRAVERILPHLGPGQSARVAFLPQGEDPDSLLRQGGQRAMRDVLDASIPLAEALWRMETESRVADSPESKAAVKAALEARVATITDRDVQSYYRSDMRRRLDEAFMPQRPAMGWGGNGGGWGGNGNGGGGRWSGGRSGQPPRRHTPGLPGLRTSAPPGFRRPKPGQLAVERERVLLAVLINHPALFDEMGEPLALLAFADPQLEALRRAVIDFLASAPLQNISGDSTLDAAELCRHLSSVGHDTIVGSLLGESTYVHAWYARPDAPLDEARKEWRSVWQQLHQMQLMADLREAEAALARDSNEANFARVVALLEEVRTARMGGPDEDDEFSAS